MPVHSSPKSKSALHVVTQQPSTSHILSLPTLCGQYCLHICSSWGVTRLHHQSAARSNAARRLQEPQVPLPGVSTILRGGNSGQYIVAVQLLQQLQHGMYILHVPVAAEHTTAFGGRPASHDDAIVMPDTAWDMMRSCTGNYKSTSHPIHKHRHHRSMQLRPSSIHSLQLVVFAHSRKEPDAACIWLKRATQGLEGLTSSQSHS
jgi:hypothetical protein